MYLTTQMIQKLTYFLSLFFPGTAVQGDAQTGVMSYQFKTGAEHRIVCMFYIKMFFICIAPSEACSISSFLKFSCIHCKYKI